MPSRPSSKGQKRQVNMRLDTETVEVLEAVMFLEGKGSLQEVITPLVERYAEDRSRDPAVQDMLEQRARFQASLWDRTDQQA